MINIDKNKETLLKVGINFAVDKHTGKLCVCRKEIPCMHCLFENSEETCEIARAKWLLTDADELYSVFTEDEGRMLVEFENMFNVKIMTIQKKCLEKQEYLLLKIHNNETDNNENISLPCFSKETAFKNMEIWKKYNEKEMNLDLWKQENENPQEL